MSARKPCSQAEPGNRLLEAEPHETLQESICSLINQKAAHCFGEI
ncbi:hypothetical protein NUACC26_052130 [Scytonema sp. NUACC26]